jgi:hypothetical protein
MDSLKDEYHQRVVTLERKVGHFTIFFLLLDASIVNWWLHIVSKFSIDDHLKGLGAQCYDLDMLVCYIRLHCCKCITYCFFVVQYFLLCERQAWCSGESCLTEWLGHRFKTVSSHLRGKICLGLSLPQTPLMWVSRHWVCTARYLLLYVTVGIAYDFFCALTIVSIPDTTHQW